MRKNTRRISALVTAQTAHNLDRLATLCGYNNIGRVIDKLVREKMIQLSGERGKGEAERWQT